MRSLYVKVLDSVFLIVYVNLRSLVARAFYGACHDAVRLVDVLSHSSIETMRIYLLSTEKEYARQLDRLGLIQ